MMVRVELLEPKRERSHSNTLLWKSRGFLWGKFELQKRKNPLAERPVGNRYRFWLRDGAHFDLSPSWRLNLQERLFGIDQIEAVEGDDLILAISEVA